MPGQSKHLASCFAATAMLACAAQAETVADAGAADLSVQINLIGLSALNVSPLAPVAIIDATAPAIDSDAVADVGLGDALISVDADAIANVAEYAPTPGAAGAQSEVSGLNISAAGPIGPPLLTITADAIRSRAIVSGRCAPTVLAGATGLFDDYVFVDGFDGDGLAPGYPGDGDDDGQTGFTNLVISIAGINVPIPVDPPPNTTVDLGALGIVGATLVLNEQTTGGDGVTSVTNTVTALRLTLGVTGVASANVVIARSESALGCM
ncbi:MAG: hypothetical protein J0L88_09640 [Xanthomonadales bacterium]|nr:hypothetical protein [Xanthomonadales bacterium]